MAQLFLASIFKNETDILQATAECRKKGLSIYDVYTPYPIHGMDEAMGLKPTRLPKICFLLGAIGFAVALLFQYWVFSVDWPLNIGGKPFNAFPAYIPVAFEVTILFAGLGVVAALFIRRKMWPGKEFKWTHLKMTDDQFVLVVEKGKETQKICKANGAIKVEEIEF